MTWKMTACAGGALSLTLAALLTPHAVWAAGPQEVASTLAAELVEGITAAELAAQPVVVPPLPVPEGGGKAVESFPGLLIRALVNEQGLSLVDRQALALAAREAQLESLGDASAVRNLAGQLGAKVMITGTMDEVADGYRVNLKAIAIEDGRLLATAAGTIAASEASVPSPTPAGASARGKPLSLQAELRRLSDRLAANLGKLEGEARYQTFAVLPFQEVGAATVENQLGTLVAAELSTYLQRDHDLLMVERGQLARVIDEMALSQTGLVDEKNSVQVGKLAGAQVLIMGTVSAAGAQYLVNAKVVESATATVAVVEKAELPAADLIALSADAVVLRSTFGAVYRSALVPGWGQFYNRQPVKAGLFIGGEVLSLALSLTFFFLAEDRAAYYDGLGAGTATVEFRSALSEARTYGDLALAFGLVTVAVHLINVVDAYLSGETYGSGAASVSAFASGRAQP